MKMTPELEAVISAARDDWWLERRGDDPGERQLIAALCRAFPRDVHTRETCSCGEQEGCDECPTRFEVDAMIAKADREAGQGRTDQ
jgi:hypothetical protein